MDGEDIRSMVEKQEPIPPDSYVVSDDDPIRRYDQLPKSTRLFLQDLRPEDIQDMRDGSKLLRDARVAKRFGTWTVATFVALFLVGDQLLTAFKNIIAFFQRATTP